MNTEQRRHIARNIANGLGWFSIGLGVAEIVAPRHLARFIGVRDRGLRRNVLRAYGLREIAAGVGILTRPKPAGWVWSRVAGDAMDLASLGSAFGTRDARRGRLAWTTASVVGVTALDVLCAQQLTRELVSGGRATFTRTIIINRSPEEVYQFWRNMQNLPKFIRVLESVEMRDGRAHWRGRLPGGRTVEFDSEIIDDHPNESIAWRSIEGAPLPISGSVRFEAATGRRGTLVRLEIRFEGAAGEIAGRIANTLGVPAAVIDSNLRALKQILETGEVLRSDSSLYPGAHAARPPERLPQNVPELVAAH